MNAKVLKSLLLPAHLLLTVFLSGALQEARADSESEVQKKCLKVLEGAIESASLDDVFKACDRQRVHPEILDVVLHQWSQGRENFQANEWPVMWRFSITPFCRRQPNCSDLSAKLIHQGIPQTMRSEVEQSLRRYSQVQIRNLFLHTLRMELPFDKDFEADAHLHYWAMRALGHSHDWEESKAMAEEFEKKFPKHSLRIRVAEWMNVVYRRTHERELLPSYLLAATKLEVEQPGILCATQRDPHYAREMFFHRYFGARTNFQRLSTSDLANRSCFDGTIEDLKITQIRTLWNLDKNEEALKRIEEEFPNMSNNARKSQLILIHSSILAEHKEYEQALAYLQQHRGTWQGSAQQVDLLTREAWWTYRLKNYDRAEQLFRNLRYNRRARDLIPYSIYFRANSLARLGKSEEALGQYREAYRIDQYGYYGLKSILRARELDPKVEFTMPDYQTRHIASTAEETSWLQEEPNLGTTAVSKNRWYLWAVHHLHQNNQNRAARLFFDRFRRSIPSSLQEEAFMISEIIEDYRSSNFIAYQRFQQNYANLFPFAYQEPVVKSSAKRNIEPALVFSVMKQESRFDRYAVSPASAFGLLQMTWPTAQRRLAEFDLPIKEPSDLFVPEKNIEIGVVELFHLSRLYGQNLAFILAGYNAGEEATQKWVSRMQGVPLEDFVEMIPFRETRNYVKRISAYYFHYKNMLEIQNIKSPASNMVDPIFHSDQPTPAIKQTVSRNR